MRLSLLAEVAQQAIVVGRAPPRACLSCFPRSKAPGGGGLGSSSLPTSGRSEAIGNSPLWHVRPLIPRPPTAGGGGVHAGSSLPSNGRETPVRYHAEPSL